MDEPLRRGFSPATSLFRHPLGIQAVKSSVKTRETLSLCEGEVVYKAPGAF